MRKKTREGKGAVNNEMWNISGGKRGPCCGYGSEKVMSKGHYLQLLKRKYKFKYNEKNRKTKSHVKRALSAIVKTKIQVHIQTEKQESKNLGRNKDKDKWNVSAGKRPPTVLPDLGEKKPCQKSKGQFVVGEYKTKTKNEGNGLKLFDKKFVNIVIVMVMF